MERCDEERYANDNYDEETLASIKALTNEPLSAFVEQIKENDVLL